MNFEDEHPRPDPAHEPMLPGMQEWCQQHRTPRPASVICTGQQVSRIQRHDRYLPETVKHPGRMLPAIARHIIETYTEPHDLVLDPMCGIGTTLIEAMHLGRNAVGIEYEEQWAHLAQRGINHARTQGAPGAGYVWHADARHIPDEVAAAVHGRVKLLLTSPPYGPSCHGQVQIAGRAGHTGKLEKTSHRYSRDRRNLAHRPAHELLTGFTDILTAARPLLAPGGIIAITARPWRRGGHLIDLPSAVIRAGQIAGYTPLERCIALLARCEQENAEHSAEHHAERLIAHGSFFQLDSARRSNTAGIPRSLITHEDIQLFELTEQTS